jgi:hypothetical protein
VTLRPTTRGGWVSCGAFALARCSPRSVSAAAIGGGEWSVPFGPTTSQMALLASTAARMLQRLVDHLRQSAAATKTVGVLATLTAVSPASAAAADDDAGDGDDSVGVTATNRDADDDDDDGDHRARPGSASATASSADCSVAVISGTEPGGAAGGGGASRVPSNAASTEAAGRERGSTTSNGSGSSSGSSKSNSSGSTRDAAGDAVCQFMQQHVATLMDEFQSKQCVLEPNILARLAALICPDCDADTAAEATAAAVTRGTRRSSDGSVNLDDAIGAPPVAAGAAAGATPSVVGDIAEWDSWEGDGSADLHGDAQWKIIALVLVRATRLIGGTCVVSMVGQRGEGQMQEVPTTPTRAATSPPATNTNTATTNQATNTAPTNIPPPHLRNHHAAITHNDA